MNEKPILFSAAMVLEILEGRKTQTRRVVNLSRVHGFDTHDMWQSVGKAKDGSFIFWSTKQPPEDTKKYYDDGGFICPYGQPGDRLWVRETWKCEELEPYGEDGVRFRADGAFRKIENSQEASQKWADAYREGGKWRPSIFMPRWASRITLEVVNVRVERVQDISRDDAKAEGVSKMWISPPANEKHYPRVTLNPYVANYSVLWDEINGKRGFGWDVNPWVWVVEFKVV